jgi:hypothetical protein
MVMSNLDVNQDIVRHSPLEAVLKNFLGFKVKAGSSVQPL